MLKIRRPLGRLIFNMGIAIPGKTVFLIETAPWRQPVFQFRIPEVVGFKYPASQSWRSWPTTTTFRQFILGEAHDKIISRIMKQYGNEMQQEVLRRKIEFNRIKGEIVSSLSQLYDEMEYIRRESAMDEAFVM